MPTSRHDHEISGVKFDIQRPNTPAIVIIVVIVVLTLWALATVLRPFQPAIQNIATYLTTITAWIVQYSAFATVIFTGLVVIVIGALKDRSTKRAEERREERLSIRHGDVVIPFSTEEIDHGIHTASIYGVVSSLMTRAEQPFPELRSYHNRPVVQTPAVNQLSEQSSQLPTPTIPTFTSLWQSRTFDVDKVVMGMKSDGELLSGTWKRLYSTGLGGLQGSGKTWTACFLAAQGVLNGAKLIVIDPHAGNEESMAMRISPLQPAFLTNIASSVAEIEAVLDLLKTEIATRKATNTIDYVLITIIDEWTALLRDTLAKKLIEGIVEVSTEGRKYHVHAMLLGQRWSADSAGGTDIRNTLSSHYVHRTRKEEARMQLGLYGNAVPKDTLQLTDGSAYLLDTRGDLNRVWIPRMTENDLVAVGNSLQNSIKNEQMIFTSDGTWTAHGRHMDGKADGQNPPSQRDKPLSAEALQIKTLFLAGYSLSEIISTVRSVNSNDGRPYRTAKREIEDLLRESLQ